MHISQEFTETVFLIFKGIIIDGESRDSPRLQLSRVGNQQERCCVLRFKCFEETWLVKLNFTH